MRSKGQKKKTRIRDCQTRLPCFTDVFIFLFQHLFFRIKLSQMSSDTEDVFILSSGAESGNSGDESDEFAFDHVPASKVKKKKNSPF